MAQRLNRARAGLVLTQAAALSGGEQIMTIRMGLGGGVFAFALAVSGAAFAHHGWSSYDAQKALKPSGKVLASSWGSPHGAVTLEVDGKRWEIVLAPVSRMEARGLKQDDIAVGKTVALEAYPRTDGTLEMRAERIIVDGKTVELR